MTTFLYLYKKNDMKKKGLNILIICLSLFFFGCQHNEIYDSDLVTTEGYIDLHLVGRSADDIQLDESVRYSVYPVGKEYIYSGVSGIENDFHFSIGRQNDFIGNNFIIMDFDYRNNIVSNIEVDLSYQKNLENNTNLIFQARNGLNLESSDIIIDEYNLATGYLSGNFTFSVSNQVSPGNTKDAIVNGEFYVNVKKIVY
jgi:hypothetical protein